MIKFIWFCAAGYSFFVGVALLMSVIIFSILPMKTWRNLIIYTLAIFAVFLIFISATPLAWWFYVVWLLSILSLLLTVTLHKISSLKFPFVFRLIVLCLSIIALIAELPFQLKPSLAEYTFEKLYIIGDSVSAGIAGREEQTWPKIIREKHKINIINLAQSGATAASAIEQAAQVKSEKALILLEIGGNDIFAPTAPAMFEQNLEKLLNILSSPQNTLIMLELPLQPWQIRYGKIQRKLAKKFKVILIPKRFFVSVLSAEEASTDLAHLSPKGHQLMATQIWLLIGDSMRNATQSGEN